MSAIGLRRARQRLAARGGLARGFDSAAVRHLVLGLTLALAAAIRVAVATSSATRLDSDQAVTGIMAEKILDGEKFLFYAGQHYMGAAEQYAQALALALFPQSEMALKSPSILLSVLTCFVVYRVGTLVLGSPTRGVVAAGLYALGPYFNVVFGAKASGAYASGQLVAITGLYLALVFTRNHPRSRWLAFAFGVALGAGYWLNWTSALQLLPAALWFLGSIRGRVLRLGALVAGGFLVGASPAIAHAVRYRVIPHPPQGPASTVYGRAESLTDAVLPAFTGLKIGHGGAISEAVPSSVILLGLVGALGAAVWSRRRGLIALVLGRAERREPIDAILLGFLLIPVVWLPLKLGAIVVEPRYLLALAPALSIALVALVVGLAPRNPRVQTLGFGTLLLATAALTALSTNRVVDSGGYSPVVTGGVPVRTSPLRALVPELERRRITAVYAEYWVAYVLQFLAGDRIAVEATDSPRFADLSARVARDPSPAYVAPAGFPAEVVERALREAGATYRTLRVEGATLFYAVRPKIGRLPAPGARAGAAGDTARAFFATLGRRVDPARAAGLGSTYLFEVKGAGTWFVDTRGDRLSVSEGRRRADCTISTDEETFERILAGQLDPATALTTGEVTVRGDLDAGLRLLALF